MDNKEKERDFYYYDCDFEKTSCDKKTQMEKEYEAFEILHITSNASHKPASSRKL